MNVVQFPGTQRAEPPPAASEPTDELVNELMRVELRTRELQLAQMQAEMHRSNVLWGWHCFKRVLFWAFVLWLVLHFTGGAKAEPWTTRSYYNGNGSFAGSSSSQGHRTSFYDNSGRFSGTAIKYGNRTNFYDGRGRFSGTAINTGPRR